MVRNLLMTELRCGESGSQRSYILVLVKIGGKSYGGSHSRVDAVTSQEQAGKRKKLLHLTLLPTASCFLSSKNSELCQNGGLEVLIPSQPSHSPHQLPPKLPETLLLPTALGCISRQSLPVGSERMLVRPCPCKLVLRLVRRTAVWQYRCLAASPRASQVNYAKTQAPRGSSLPQTSSVIPTR